MKGPDVVHAAFFVIEQLQAVAVIDYLIFCHLSCSWFLMP
jgi:hypothetical protein